MSGLPRVHDFLFSPDYPWLAFAATSGGIYRTQNGGASWSHVYGKVVSRLYVSPTNSHEIYAVGAGGVYKSIDLGERKMATAWKELTNPALSSGAVFAVDTRGAEATLYRLAEDGLYIRSESAAVWQTPIGPVRTRGFGSLHPISGTPLWIRVDETKPGRLFRAVSMQMARQKQTMITVSDDNGKTWSPILRKLTELMKWASGEGETVNITGEELMGLIGLTKQFPITDLRVDREDPNRWYGLMSSGVAITEDAGETWRMSQEGLDIPRVHTLWTPRESSDIYVGTPAGLYISRDHGETWSDTSLILQFSGVEREEISGSGYLTAYWMGRYHHFINDETAAATWWK